MRRILTAACAVLLCAGCSSGADDVPSSAGSGSCAARITWHGAVYYGQTFASLPPDTLVLGTGGRPTCRDHNGGEAGASSTVLVRRLVGVDPAVAVAVREPPEAVAYLAAGYFVQLPSHPLHRSVSRTARSLNELRGCRLSPLLRVEGTVRYGPSVVLDVSERDASASRYVGDEALLFVDAHTRFDGLSRHGLPYLAPGAHVAIEAIGCLARDGKLAKLVPRRISRA